MTVRVRTMVLVPLTVWGLAVLLIPAGELIAAGPVSLKSLLGEMVDRDHLARFPSPAYVCRQFSSYDRRTVAPDQPGSQIQIGVPPVSSQSPWSPQSRPDVAQVGSQVPSPSLSW